MSYTVIGSRATLERYAAALEDESDDLAPARGLCNGFVLGLLAWAFIASLVLVALSL